ncbi:MAG: hypothetical protein QW038_02025 [Nanopusillaceae archaeon]
MLDIPLKYNAIKLINKRENVENKNKDKINIVKYFLNINSISLSIKYNMKRYK